MTTPRPVVLRPDTSYEELDAFAADPTVSICWCHHAIEPIPENVYRVCFECGHVWTKKALVKAYRREVRSMEFIRAPYERVISGWLRHQFFGIWRPLTIRASGIYFCQECIHDW